MQLNLTKIRDRYDVVAHAKLRLKPNWLGWKIEGQCRIWHICVGNVGKIHGGKGREPIDRERREDGETHLIGRVVFLVKANEGIVEGRAHCVGVLGSGFHIVGFA